MDAPQVSDSLEGGCLCGLIRYRVTGPALTLYACHCTDCQKQSGSAFGMSMMFLKTQFRLLQGTPRTLTKTFVDDGRQKFAHFCGDCGARIWVEFTKAPEVLNIKPGTLDDTRGLQPIGHIWTRSAQPWVAPALDGVCAETQPDMPEMIRAFSSGARTAPG
jgi:hypothetical protein